MSQAEMKDRREEILQGNILKATFTLAWPVIVGNILSTVYNIADTFWLGKISPEAIAIPSVAWPIMFLFLSVSMGLATSGMSLVSQHTGGAEYEKANKAAGQVFSLLLITGGGISVLGYFGAHWLLASFVSVPQTILPLGTRYLQIMFISLPLSFTFMASRFIFRSIGNMKLSLYLRTVSIAVDGVLNPFLILGIEPFPRWGVIGAGVTNFIGRGVAASIAVYYLFSGKTGIDISLPDLRLERDWVKQIFRIAGPATFSRGGSGLAFVVYNAFVAAFGTIALSGYGIGRRMTQMINIGIWGFTSSVSTMVGQNVGDRNMERAETIVKRALLVSSIIMFSISSVIILFRESLIHIFINNAAVIKEGAAYVAITCFSTPFFGILRIISSAYQGSGHTRFSMGLSLGRLWILRIGLAYLLGFYLGWGSNGLWWGMALSNIITASIAYPLFLTGNWKEKTARIS